MNEWVVILAMMVTFLFIAFCLLTFGFGIWLAIQKLKIQIFGEPPAIRRN